MLEICFKSRSVPALLHIICFIEFSYLVYTHAVGIHRPHRVRNFILKKRQEGEASPPHFPEGRVEVLYRRSY